MRERTFQPSLFLIQPTVCVPDRSIIIDTVTTCLVYTHGVTTIQSIILRPLLATKSCLVLYRGFGTSYTVSYTVPNDKSSVVGLDHISLFPHLTLYLCCFPFFLLPFLLVHTKNCVFEITSRFLINDPTFLFVPNGTSSIGKDRRTRFCF